MEKREGARYVGAIIAVRSSRFQIIDHDCERGVFTTRNLFTRREGEITTREVEDAIADGIITIEKRRRA